MSKSKKPYNLSEEALRHDLEIEFMFTHGYLALSPVSRDSVQHLVEEQIELLIPTIKKHIRRHVKHARDDRS